MRQKSTKAISRQGNMQYDLLATKKKNENAGRHAIDVRKTCQSKIWDDEKTSRIFLVLVRVIRMS